MTETQVGHQAAQSASLTRIAAGLAAAAVLAMVVVLAAADADGPIWIVQGVLAAAAVVVAWRAGGTTPQNALAFGAFIVGTILFVTFMAGLVVVLFGYKSVYVVVPLSATLAGTLSGMAVLAVAEQRRSRRSHE